MCRSIVPEAFALEPLGALAHAQAAQLVVVLVDEASHLVGEPARAVAQRPADGLADEELLLVGAREAQLEELGVGVRSMAILAEDRRAPDPHVVVVVPLAHQRREPSAAVQERASHEVGGDKVDEVPPLAVADELLEEPHRLWHVKRLEAIGVGLRHVLVLALGLVPERANGRLVVGERARRELGEHRLLRRRPVGFLHAVERVVGLQVGGHRLGVVDVPMRLEARAHQRDERVGVDRLRTLEVGCLRGAARHSVVS
jgi:hypothetical protein